MKWTCFTVHYTNIDQLLTRDVRPLFKRLADQIDAWYFDRHYAGGPHVRLNVRIHEGKEDEVAATILSTLGRAVDAHPSPPAERYSASDAAHMIREEGEDPEDYNLTARVNVVEQIDYLGLDTTLATSEAVELLEDFYVDVAPFIIDVIGSPVSRRVRMLQMAFVHCLELTNGVMEEAGLSYRSHWGGFASRAPSLIVERIQGAYEQNRPAIREVMKQVERSYSDGYNAAFDDPSTAASLQTWAALVRTYTRRTADLKKSGKEVFGEMRADYLEEKRAYHKDLGTDDDFLAELFSDDEYLMSLNHDAEFTAARVSINLFYLLFPLLGLKPTDKYNTCYSVFTTIEQVYDRDMADTLRQLKQSRSTSTCSTAAA